MATVTAVLTYDGTLGTGSCNVTSYTWGGSAFADMTVAEAKQALQALMQAYNITLGAGSSATPKGQYHSQAAQGRSG